MEVANGSGSESSSSAVPFPSSSATLTPLRFLRFPVSAILEYSGILRVRPESPESVGLMADGAEPQNAADGSSGSGEVSIRIIGAGEQDRGGVEAEEEEDEEAAVEDRGVGGAGVVSDDSGDGGGGNGGGRGSSYQRYDIQRIARWIEQVLPFSLLLLVVFIRQHLQGMLKI